MLNKTAIRRLIDCEFFPNGCDDTSTISQDEAFSAILNYEGIIGYENWIKSLIKDIYGVSI